MCMNHRRCPPARLFSAPQRQVLINTHTDDTYVYRGQFAEIVTHSWHTLCQRFNAIWLKLCTRKTTHTHTHTHMRICKHFLLDFQRFPQKLLWNFTLFFSGFFLEFFAFLFAVCLARILIIGNKFVFNSTTLSTKRKSCSREEQRGGRGAGRCRD